MTDENSSAAVKKWKDMFPEHMSADGIFTILKNCSFDEDKINDAIARIWEDSAATPPSTEEVWAVNDSTAKKNKKKNAANSKSGKGGKGNNARPQQRNSAPNGKGAGTYQNNGKGRGKSAPPPTSATSRPNPRGTGRGSSTGPAPRGGGQSRVVVEESATVVTTTSAGGNVTSTWASSTTTTTAVGGGWVNNNLVPSNDTNDASPAKESREDGGLGVGLVLNDVVDNKNDGPATAIAPVLPSVSAWSRGSASIIKAAMPPPPAIALPTNTMENVTAFLDDDLGQTVVIENERPNAGKTSVIPSSTDLSLTLESISPVESAPKPATPAVETSEPPQVAAGSTPPSVTGSPARGSVDSSVPIPNSPQAPTLRLGKYANMGTDNEFAFNFGSFGDAIDSTWSNSSTAGGGWGDDDILEPSPTDNAPMPPSSSATSSTAPPPSSTASAASTATATSSSPSNNVVSGFFGEVQGGIKMKAPPGLSAPDIGSMKTVEELEAEQAAAAAAVKAPVASTASAVETTISAPPGMGPLPSTLPPPPPPSVNNVGNPTSTHTEHSKPPKKHSHKRNNNNNNGSDKNNIMPAMQLGGYPPGAMYGYNMEHMYSNMPYPNMMMMNQQGNMPPAPPPLAGTEGSNATGVTPPNVSSNLVDEGLGGATGNASPVSSQHPGYGNMGMQGYMPGFTAPPQNPYAFYGGGYPGGWSPAFAAQFPAQNYGQPGNPNNSAYSQQGQQGNVGSNVYPNMDPSLSNGYGYPPNMNMDGNYFSPQPQGGGGTHTKGKGGNSNSSKAGSDKNSEYRGNTESTSRGRNRGNGGDNNSPNNGATGNNKSWGGFQGNNADPNMMWQQQQAFHMMQGNPSYSAQAVGPGQGGNPSGGGQYQNYYPPQPGQSGGGQGNWRA